MQHLSLLYDCRPDRGGINRLLELYRDIMIFVVISQGRLLLKIDKLHLVRRGEADSCNLNPPYEKCMSIKKGSA